MEIIHIRSWLEGCIIASSWLTCIELPLQIQHHWQMTDPHVLMYHLLSHCFIIQHRVTDTCVCVCFMFHVLSPSYWMYVSSWLGIYLIHLFHISFILFKTFLPCPSWWYWNDMNMSVLVLDHFGFIHLIVFVKW